MCNEFNVALCLKYCSSTRILIYIHCSFVVLFVLFFNHGIKPVDLVCVHLRACQVQLYCSKKRCAVVISLMVLKIGHVICGVPTLRTIIHHLGIAMD